MEPRNFEDYYSNDVATAARFEQQQAMPYAPDFEPDPAPERCGQCRRLLRPHEGYLCRSCESGASQDDEGY